MMKTVALGLVLALSACGHDDRDHVDQDHDRAGDRTGVLGEATHEVAFRNHADILHAAETAQLAEERLDAREQARLDRLRTRLELVEVQEPMLRGLADVLPLTDSGRADVNAKLDALKARLDEATLSVDRADEAHGQRQGFPAAEQAARNAVLAADEARTVAWKAVGDAKRPDEATPSAP